MRLAQGGLRRPLFRCRSAYQSVLLLLTPLGCLSLSGTLTPLSHPIAIQKSMRVAKVLINLALNWAMRTDSVVLSHRASLLLSWDPEKLHCQRRQVRTIQFCSFQTRISPSSLLVPRSEVSAALQGFVVFTLVDTEYGNVITYVDCSCHSLNDRLDLVLEYLSRSVYSKRESLVRVKSNIQFNSIQNSLFSTQHIVNTTMFFLHTTC